MKEIEDWTIEECFVYIIREGDLNED